jgi:hypothetical protein
VNGKAVPLLLHTIVVLALVGAYLAVTLTGKDATALLGVLGGYLGGAGVQNMIGQARGTA